MGYFWMQKDLCRKKQSINPLYLIIRNWSDKYCIPPIHRSERMSRNKRIQFTQCCIDVLRDSGLSEFCLFKFEWVERAARFIGMASPFLGCIFLAREKSTFRWGSREFASLQGTLNRERKIRILTERLPPRQAWCLFRPSVQTHHLQAHSAACLHEW